MSLIKSLDRLSGGYGEIEDGRVSASLSSTSESTQEDGTSLWGWDTPDAGSDRGDTLVEVLSVSTNGESAGESADIGTTHPLTGERYEDDAVIDSDDAQGRNLRITCHGTELPRCSECICLGSGTA